MSEKDKKACEDSNYFEHFFVFISAISGCVTIFTFSSLVGVNVGIMSSALGLKICTVIATVKKYIS